MARSFLYFLIASALTGVTRSSEIPLFPHDPIPASSWEYSNCGAYLLLMATDIQLSSVAGQLTDLIQIHSIKVSPDPPKPGQDLTVTVSAYVQEEIEASQVSRTLLLLHLFSIKI